VSANELPLTLSVEDAARLLGISRGLCYQGVRDGSIPSISIGRRRLVPRARLLELVGAETSFGSNSAVLREEVNPTTAPSAGNGEAGSHPASSPLNPSP
jgi:excisionase family DNA binding protein